MGDHGQPSDLSTDDSNEDPNNERTPRARRVRRARLPSRRHSSPWARRWMLLALLAVIALAPLWLREVFINEAPPTAAPTATITITPEDEP